MIDFYKRNAIRQEKAAARCRDNGELEKAAAHDFEAKNYRDAERREND